MDMNLFFANNRRVGDLAVQIQHSWLWLICFVAAYISSFFLSGGSAPQADLDQSYQVVLEYARTHNFQFGEEIIFTFGPYGFLNTWISQGMFPLQRVFFALVWSCFVAWSAIGLAQQIQGRLKYLFLIWFLIYSPLGWLEQHALLVMIYGCMILMDDAENHKGAMVSFLTLFALLALIKFTFFMAAAIGIFFTVLVQLGKRNVKQAIVISIYYLAALLALWFFSGQQLENFLPWIKGSLQIAGGYTGAMTIVPKKGVLFLCVLAGSLYFAVVIVVFRTARLRLSSIGVALVTTAYVFLSWKHGFVRADGHVVFFIFFLPMACAVLLTKTFTEHLCKRGRICLTSFIIGIVLLCNWAADIQEPGIMLTKLVSWPGYMVGNSRLVFNSISGKWDKCFEARHVKPLKKVASDLPVARAVVGSNTVDVLNYRQWAALANNLNYRPRPVIQGYSAYTPFLQDINLSWYRSDNRPNYLLFKMETIDNRFPALDDAPLLPYILNNYKPVAKDGEFLILKSDVNQMREIGMTLLQERVIAFDESIEMSAYQDGLYMLQVDVEKTLLGRLVEFLFQSPIVSMVLEKDDKTTTYRFVPEMAKRGFVISPVILTNDDVMDFFNDGRGNYVHSLSFHKPKWYYGQLSKTIKIRIYKRTIERGIL